MYVCVQDVSHKEMREVIDYAEFPHLKINFSWNRMGCAQKRTELSFKKKLQNS